MPVPDYESLMLPLLRIAGDKKEHQPKEVTERLSEIFHLTPEEKEARLPSGRKNLMYSRVHWAKTYIMNAGLLESTARGKYKITQRGLDVLASNPSCINNEFLDQFQEFREFRQRRHDGTNRQARGREAGQTPEELLESSYQEVNDTLARELLDRIMQAPAGFFEQLVVDLLLAMGYGGFREDAGKAIGGVGDAGVDGIINEDKLGLDAVYIQAKRWAEPVGREKVQAFVGSLAGQDATKGVMVTTSAFTDPAKDYVERGMGKKVVLIDGKRLAKLMIEHNIGVAEVASYTVKRIDLDYFGEE